LNAVQSRFEVEITELPDQIDVSTYSTFFFFELMSCFLCVLRLTFFYVCLYSDVLILMFNRHSGFMQTQKKKTES
jgi:hypothetical protein